MSAPLSYDTAKNIRDRLNIESNHEANFITALAKIHEKSPYFVEDMLEFLELCHNLKQPNYPFLELNLGQD